MANNGNGDKSLESWIWDAACSIRGAKDAPKYKEYILPLIFAKRLCDVFDDELNRIAKEVGSRAKAFKLVKHDKKLVRFFLPLEPKNPDDPVWSIIRKLADKIGEQLTTLLRDIADENSLLKGIIDRVDFNATTHGVRDLDDDRLSNLIERISEKRLGSQRCRAGHHRPVLRISDPQVRRGQRLQRRRILHAERSRHGHGAHPRPRAGNERLRSMLRLGGPAHQVPIGSRRKDEPALAENLRAAPALRPGVHAGDLGDGQHEHDHPRHAGPDRDRRQLQESQVSQRQPPPDFRPRGRQSRCGIRTGGRKPTTTTTS